MTEQQLHIGFIGGGNMAQAIVRGLLRTGHPAGCLHVADPGEAPRRALAELHANLRVSAHNADVIKAADVLVLAVKPQVMETVLAEYAGLAHPADQLLVSIAAGITLESVQHLSGTVIPAVRVMPNQPALVGAGISVLTASTSAGEAHRRRAQYVAEAVGTAVWIDDESLMDAVTAVSGSGPAYFYLLMEIMQETAIRMGLPADLAATLVEETAFGAACTARQEAAEFAGLRTRVTSPGGTTEAAIKVLEDAGIRDIFRTALMAARDRSVELGLK